MQSFKHPQVGFGVGSLVVEGQKYFGSRIFISIEISVRDLALTAIARTSAELPWRAIDNAVIEASTCQSRGWF